MFSSTTSSSSASGLLNIEKLTTDNYAAWRQRVQALLMHNKLWKVVSTSTVPDFRDDGGGKAEWEEKDEMALAEITLTISTSQLGYIRACTTAREAWLKLAEVHNPKSAANLLYVRKELHHCKLEETTPGAMQAHINRIRDLVDRLAGMDSPVSPLDAAVSLFNSMPEQYDTIAVTLSMRPVTDLTFDFVATALLAEERRQHEAAASTSTTARAESALVAAAAAAGDSRRGTNQHKDRNRASRPTCEYCHKTGHTEAQCYTKHGYPVGHPKHSGSVGTSPNHANPYAGLASGFIGAAVNNDATSFRAAAPAVNASAALEQQHSDPTTTSRASTNACEWLIDSGASWHLCSTRTWLADYKPYPGTTLTLGDGHVISAAGTGHMTVHIPLNGRTFRTTFCDVLHIPDIPHNLLSVSKLTQAGLQVSFHGHTCIIRSDRGDVIGRAVKQSNQLYRFIVRPQPVLLTHPTDGRTEQAAVLLARTTEASDSAPAASSLPTLQLAHERMGHLNMRSLLQLRSAGMNVTWTKSANPDSKLQCESCFVGKAHRAAMPQQATHRATAPLELVHSDVCGPMRTTSLSGFRYFVLFVDDCTRFMVVYPVSHKHEVLNRFLLYKAWAETMTGKRLQCLRTDGGGEYSSRAFNATLNTHGIRRQRTPPYTPEHNGVAERANRTLMEAVRCMIHQARLPDTFWALALLCAVHLRNRSPTRALASTTPFEAWTGRKPSFADLRVFGCLAFVHVPAAKRGKLDVKARPGIFVGYSHESKAWLVFDPVRATTVTSRNVQFMEDRSGMLAYRLSDTSASSIAPQLLSSHSDNDSMVGDGGQVDLTDSNAVSCSNDESEQDSHAEHPSENSSLSDEELEEDAQNRRPLSPFSSRLENQPPSSGPLSSSSATSSVLSPWNSVLNQQTEAPTLEPAPRRSSRAHVSSRALDAGTRRTQIESAPMTTETLSSSSSSPVLSGLSSFISALSSSPRAHGLAAVSPLSPAQAADDEPSSFSHAMTRTDRQQWELAAKEEYRSIQAAGTWKLTPLPAGRHAIGCKWVFKLKRKADGTVDRYKARLVAKGYSQKEGIDYTETFAPVAKFASIRALLSLAAYLDLELHQMDVHTAFLNGDLHHDIYMQQPEGFVVAGQERLVCKLQKSLYGLKQAGRAWYEKIHLALVELGFHALHADTCIYQLRRGSLVMLIALYVDDLLLLSNSLDGLTALKQDLARRFAMKDLGEAHYVLGIQINRNRAARTLHISQQEYISKVLQRFGMTEAKAVPTPLDSSIKLTKADCPTPNAAPDFAFIQQYQSAVGAIMYAMLGTRPDIAFAVASLSQFSSNPGQSHWAAVRHVLRYLCGSAHYKLTYGPAPSLTPESSILRLPTLQGYCDSDWGADRDDRRSVTGYVFMLGGGAVSWQSKKQHTVALSSVEAEYMASTQATKEALWWRTFLIELGMPKTITTVIHSDSQGSIALSKNPEHHARSKHIDIRHHFVREQVAAGTVALQYVPTHDMIADVLTKSLSKLQHTRLVHTMGVHSVQLPQQA
jgi:transposase InsO family protein